MIAVAPHHRFVQPLLASYISFGVGCYCFIRTKAMREAKEMGETNIVPTPSFFNLLSSGNWLAQLINMVRLLVFIGVCILKATGNIDIPWWVIILVFILSITDFRKLMD